MIKRIPKLKLFTSVPELLNQVKNKINGQFGLCKESTIGPTAVSVRACRQQESITNCLLLTA